MDFENKEETEKDEDIESPILGKKKNNKKKSLNDNNIQFDPKKYIVVEKYNEQLPMRELNRRGQLVTTWKDTGRTLEREVLSDEFILKYGKGKREHGVAMHQAKCCFRTGEAFNVELERISETYLKIGSKKIDGFFISDLFDRFGWSEGTQVSRQMLADKYKKPRVSVDIAQKKLYTILREKDILKAYMKLVKDIKDTFVNELRDEVVHGE